MSGKNIDWCMLFLPVSMMIYCAVIYMYRFAFNCGSTQSTERKTHLFMSTIHLETKCGFRIKICAVCTSSWPTSEGLHWPSGVPLLWYPCSDSNKHDPGCGYWRDHSCHNCSVGTGMRTPWNVVFLFYMLEVIIKCSHLT
jgi:hypothetical protein